jgi:hypothetical protein
VLAVIAVAASARTRLTATAGGAHLTVPVLWLLAAIVLLALVALVLWLIRLAVRDGGFWHLRPKVVTT